VPLFRRKSRPDVPVSSAGFVVPFWTWWAHARAEVTTALEAGRSAAVEALVAPQVSRIHPELMWEFGTGAAARHLFVVSGDGRPELRPLAERWRRAGPPDDETWEFRPARQKDLDVFHSGHVMSAGGVEVNLAAVVAGAVVDDRRCRLDVSVYHPRFFEMPEKARNHLGFLVLDWALGEDDVERWVGAVEAVTVSPLDPIPVGMLGAVVDQAAERWAGERWAVLEGWHGRHRLVAAIRHPVHRVDHPLFDEHVEIRLPYRSLTADGQPEGPSAADLQVFQDAVVRRLGGSALLAAHETSMGERLLHLYGDSTASVVPLVEAMLGAYGGGGATVSGRPDPAWHALEHLQPM
jgi:hypothetical protein